MKVRGERYVRMASQRGIVPLQKAAYEQVARLYQGDFGEVIDCHDFALPRIANNPMAVLYKMGLEVLPVMVEALDDGTPTKTVTGMRPKQRKVWKVNELAALLICRIADRQFALIQGEEEVWINNVEEHRNLIPRFKKLVLDWYAKNGKKTLAERRIDDVDSDVLWNRLHAVEWIGEHREKAGQKAVLDRINVIFASKVASSDVDAELSACNLALGQIGDKKTIDSVRRICKHFSYCTYMFYRPLNEGRWGMYSNFNSYLFDAYKGLALLDEKEEALQELRRLYDTYSAEMESHAHKEYGERLEAAKRW